jgi:hypothetical protein
MSSYTLTHNGLTKPQVIGIIVAGSVVLFVLLPAALVLFWRRRIRRQARQVEQHQLEAMDPPRHSVAPVWPVDEPQEELAAVDDGRNEGEQDGREALAPATTREGTASFVTARSVVETDDETVGRAHGVA